MILDRFKTRRAKGIPLHREVVAWFAECTRELGASPLVTSDAR